MSRNDWLKSILHSYSFIFFSKSWVVAVIVLLTTFCTPTVGIITLLTIIFTNLCAYLWGISKNHITDGFYGFNALVLGLTLNYPINLSFIFLWLVAVFILTILTVTFSYGLGKSSLPFLILPSIVTCWIVELVAPQLGNVGANVYNVYIYNELALHQQSIWYELVHIFDKATISPLIANYCRTLTSVLFQDSVFMGILLALAILYSSRILFSLSILGYLCAHFFYWLLGVDINSAEHLIGLNFIFTALALGGFYLIPSLTSYLLVITIMPIVMFMSIFSSKFLALYGLSPFALSFCITVILFLYFIQHIHSPKGLQLVSIQYYSPEANVYKHNTAVNRFKNNHLAKISLPFFGEWTVSQGYQGTITHLSPWDNALDFVITEEENQNTYKNTGVRNEDFFAYGKAILAPADGYVYDIVNNVEDNPVGGNNIEQNWGNTIILNHLNGLFSQISHCKKDSFQVKIGDYVTQGSVLASCGNSGRSPESHIHFQLQTTPNIGAHTLAYPFAYFLEQSLDGTILRSYEIPKEGAKISNIQSTPLLSKAFDLLPRQKLKFRTEDGLESISWEVLTNAYNQSYIYCEKTQSYAYFVNDKTMFYFIDFIGDTQSPLFYFYLANYRVLQSYLPHITIHDDVPLVHFSSPLIRFFQDFIAPFTLLANVKFSSRSVSTDTQINPSYIEITSRININLLSKNIKRIVFTTEIRDLCIKTITIHKNNKKICYTRES